MKKLFTLIALMACFLGAKADVVVDKEVDFSEYTGFPFYVMGYVPEWVDGVMTDYGANYKYEKEGYETKDGETIVGQVKTNGGDVYEKVQLSSPGWHQYFFATGITTELDGSYTVTAMVKASEACSVNCNMQWSWSEDPVKATVNIGTEWQEVEWEYSGINGTSCDLIMQPGTVTATIEWKWVKVTHNATPKKEATWIELLTNGKPESATWTEGVTPCAQAYFKSCEFEKENHSAAEICELVKPCPIEEVEGEKVFKYTTGAINKADYTTRVDGSDCSGAYSYANQFFIVFPEPLKSGDKIKVSFDYKASQTTKGDTYIQGKPSVYIGSGIGTINYTTSWQSFPAKEITITTDGVQSIAFNLNEEIQEAHTYFFKNISVSKMKVDEGYFVAGANATTGLSYDFDNAIEFVYDEDEEAYTATIGTEDNEDTWVNQIMISTKRGEDASFKGATLKPTSTVKTGDGTYYDYTASTNYKINLPAAGVWQIILDADMKKMSFTLVTGEKIKEPLNREDCVNPAEITVNAVERAMTKDEGTAAGYTEGSEELAACTGQPWDNQFYIIANRALEVGEEVYIKFDYKATKAATVGTQNSQNAGGYLHWAGLGNIDFTDDWQTFEKTLTIPEATGGKQNSWTFNLANMKDANDYSFKNFTFMLADNTENLINKEGTENFMYKIGAGTEPQKPGASGISNVVADKAANANAAAYNIAGQRVANNYKGIVIKNGVKFMNK